LALSEHFFDFVFQLRTVNQAAKLFTVLHSELFTDLHRLAVSRYMEVGIMLSFLQIIYRINSITYQRLQPFEWIVDIAV